MMNDIFNWIYLEIDGKYCIFAPWKIKEIQK
jgi:hypothetical protein